MNAAPRAPDDFVPLIVYKGEGEVEWRGRGKGRDSQFPPIIERPENCLRDVLIVENDPDVAMVLREIIELESGLRVTDVVSDLAGTLAAIEMHRPQLALIDIHLGGYATGIEIAARMHELGIPTLFSTGNPLPFPVPELALGCLCKPYTCYSVAQSLRIAEQILRGDPIGHDVPLELELY